MVKKHNLMMAKVYLRDFDWEWDKITPHIQEAMNDQLAEVLVKMVENMNMSLAMMGEKDDLCIMASLAHDDMSVDALEWNGYIKTSLYDLCKDEIDLGEDWPNHVVNRLQDTIDRLKLLKPS